MDPVVITAIQSVVVWAGIEILKKAAPQFWGRNSAFIRVGLVALGASAVSVVGGVITGLGVRAILLAAGQTFVGALFGRQMAKLALPKTSVARVEGESLSRRVSLISPLPPLPSLPVLPLPPPPPKDAA